MQLTIITTVKNDVNNIDRTIKSVLLQNFQDYEYIIIDGYSNDGTSEIIQKYTKNKKIKYFRIEDKNLYEGLNKGIDFSNGEFISFLHSGDFYYNNDVLSEIFHNKNLNEYSLIARNIIFFNSNTINRIWKIPRKIKHNFYHIPHTGSFIRKNIYEKNKFNIINHISADTEVLLKFFQQKHSYLVLNKYVVFMQQGGLSTSVKNIFKKVNQDLRIIKKYFGKSFFFIYLSKIFFKIFNRQFILRDKNCLNKKLINQKNLIDEKNFTPL